MRTITVNNNLSLEIAKQYGIRTAELRKGLMEQGNCFNDALQISALLGQGAYYCEGFAVSIIPVEHAWVYYKGQIIDATWYGLPLEDRIYHQIIAISFDRIVKTRGYDTPLMRSPKLKKIGIDFKVVQKQYRKVYYQMLNL